VGGKRRSVAYGLSEKRRSVAYGLSGKRRSVAYGLSGKPRWLDKIAYGLSGRKRRLNSVGKRRHPKEPPRRNAIRRVWKPTENVERRGKRKS
jgi:hypothetical protein